MQHIKHPKLQHNSPYDDDIIIIEIENDGIALQYIHMIILALFLFLQLHRIVGEHEYILNHPADLARKALPKQCSDPALFAHEFKELHNYTSYATHGDAEAFDAAEHYFWNICNGLVVEMGAVDGITHSESLFFEKFGWKRILVDGNPERFPALRERSDALAVGAVVCASPQEVHFCINRYTPNGFTSGIVEFMTPQFIGHFHPRLYHAGRPKGSLNIDWNNHTIAGDCTVVQCIPLSSIFTLAGVKHVNFFILDIEGAELEALRTIDFSAVTFDVLVVEAARARARLYKQQVRWEEGSSIIIN